MEIILFFAGLLIGILISGICVYKKMLDQKIEMHFSLEKSYAMYQLLEKWMCCKYQDMSIESYLLDEGITSIAIYGCGDVGKLLFYDLAKSKICIKYGMDRNLEIGDFPVNVTTPQEGDKSIDAIVVTAIVYFSEIEEALREVYDCKIISLEDIIYELLY